MAPRHSSSSMIFMCFIPFLINLYAKKSLFRQENSCLNRDDSYRVTTQLAESSESEKLCHSGMYRMPDAYAHKKAPKCNSNPGLHQLPPTADSLWDKILILLSFSSLFIVLVNCRKYSPAKLQMSTVTIKKAMLHKCYKAE